MHDQRHIHVIMNIIVNPIYEHPLRNLCQSGCEEERLEKFVMELWTGTLVQQTKMLVMLSSSFGNLIRRTST